MPETVVDELSQGASPEAEAHVHGKADFEESRAELAKDGLGEHRVRAFGRT